MTRVLGRVTSINVRKVLWALDELGEAYEREDWGQPLRDPNVPEFLALNPNATVPVLVEDDGTTLWESNGLLVYLAQTRGKLLPGPRHELGWPSNGSAGRPASSIPPGAMRSWASSASCPAMTIRRGGRSR